VIFRRGRLSVSANRSWTTGRHLLMSNHSFLLLRRFIPSPARARGEPTERFLGRGANILDCRIHFIPNPSFRPSDFEFPNKFDRRRRRRRRLVELASLRDGKIASLLARRKATSPLSRRLSLSHRGIHPHPPSLLYHPYLFVPFTVSLVCNIRAPL